jgi:hypothetical protein
VTDHATRLAAAREDIERTMGTGYVLGTLW